jgi:hypothetical protein
MSAWREGRGGQLAVALAPQCGVELAPFILTQLVLHPSGGGRGGGEMCSGAELLWLLGECRGEAFSPGRLTHD